jgi:oligopeptide/dipeptide ABC transporter ATP-binding protein
MFSIQGKPLLSAPLLQVCDLRVEFTTEDGTIAPVNGISFDLDCGECVGLVGESGCGKSVTALSLLRLAGARPGMGLSGQILFDGTDLMQRSEREMERIRGKQVAMIFQEPMSALNPLMRVGEQLIETIVLHDGLSRLAARNRALEMLARVRIAAPERRLDEYPYQMSGGMLQRVMIAIALCCQPKLLIADEPTTALDVTIQAQVLDLLRELQRETGMALLLITHDLGVVAEIAERVIVMYAGQIVEGAPTAELFATPRHPYTAGLLRSVPTLETDTARLWAIEGNVPSLFNVPDGCRFHPRCDRTDGLCRSSAPPLTTTAHGRQAACHHPMAG